MWKALRSSHKPWKSRARFPPFHRTATATLTLKNQLRKEAFLSYQPYLFFRLILRLEKTLRTTPRYPFSRRTHGFVVSPPTQKLKTFHRKQRDGKHMSNGVV